MVMDSNVIKKIKFMIFLLPITISSASANYLFFTGFFKKNISKLDISNYIFVVWMVFSCSLSIIVFSDEYSVALKKILSLVGFCGMVLFSSQLNKNDLKKVLDAVVYASLLYSIWILYNIAFQPSLSFSNLYYLKKGLRNFVTDWPQRYVILLIPAFLIVFERCLNRLKIINVLQVVILLVTIFFTFTRAAYLSMIISLIVYMFSLLCVKESAKAFKMFIWLIFVTFMVVVFYSPAKEMIILLLGRILSVAISLMGGAGAGEASVNDRLFFWAIALDILNGWKSLVGAGGGVYLYTNETGSLHSQYVDIFFRYGIIGLSIFVWITVVSLYRYRKSPLILAILCSLIMYGFFHETVKLTYGGLLYFSIIGCSRYEINSVFRHKVKMA